MDNNSEGLELDYMGVGTGVRMFIEEALDVYIGDERWAAITLRCNPEQAWRDADPLEIGTIATEAYWLTQATRRKGPPRALTDFPSIDELRRGWRRERSDQHNTVLRDLAPPFVLHDPLQRDTVDAIEILAVAMASEAAEHYLVDDFRNTCLGDTLVPYSEIDDWVKAQARAAGQFTIWAEGMPLHAGATMDVLQKNGRVEIPPMPEHEAIWHHFRLRLLRYWALGKPTGGESLMPTAHGSPLERLRWNSYYLAPAYGWTEAQAATFILTGAAPRQQQIRVGLRDARDFGALSRIVLTVDPTVSPKEVAEQYRIAREVAIGRDRRPRQMDDKHLRLALVALHKRSGQTWAALLQEWNERWQAKRVEWVYPDVWNFSRDCVRAHKRLLGKTVTFIRDAEEENRSDGPHFHER